MKICLEILNAAYFDGDNHTLDIKIKELIPKMVTRRRLTNAAKIVVYLSSLVEFENGRVIYGSSFGEIPPTAQILDAIKEKENISPTHFQNSVYNTAVPYLPMLQNNQHEMITISRGDKTSENILKCGAIKALDGDILLLIATETLDIPKIEEVNSCIDILECGVALKVRVTQLSPTLDINLKENSQRFPNSLIQMINIAKNFNPTKTNIVEIIL